MRGQGAVRNDPGDRFSPEANLPHIRGELGGIISLVCPEGQLAGLSGGMAMPHVEGGLAFRTAVSLRDLALDDQLAAVLDERMNDEAQRSAGARGFPAEPGDRTGRPSKGAHGRRSAAGCGRSHRQRHHSLALLRRTPDGHLPERDSCRASR